MRKTPLLSILISLTSIAYSQDATMIYKNTVASTVTIETDNSQGSGFFVGTNMIATNYHVIEGATKAICYVNGSSTQYKIEGYLALNKSADLIILKVTGLNRESIKFTTILFHREIKFMQLEALRDCKRHYLMELSVAYGILMAIS